VLFYDYMLTDGSAATRKCNRVPANKNYDTPVRRLVREGQAVKIVNAKGSHRRLRKWHDVYKLLIGRPVAALILTAHEERAAGSSAEEQTPVTRDYLGRDHPDAR